MKTEEEARKCWCPFARQWSMGVDQMGSGGWNRHMPNTGTDDKAPYGCKCIASECMAWRVGIYKLGDGPSPRPSVAYGYCGLAGNPAAANEI